MYRSESSDQYFALKERARKLAKKSHSIAYALMQCVFCYRWGSVVAVTFHNVGNEAVRRTAKPVEHLSCVCTVGWPYYGEGDNYDGPR